LGLLPIDTVLTSPKITRRVVARWAPDGPTFEAYEIHMGRTARERGASPLFMVGDAPEGCVSTDGRVRGTYLHGVFDSPAARERLVRAPRGAGGARGGGAPPSGPPRPHRRGGGARETRQPLRSSGRCPRAAPRPPGAPPPPPAVARPPVATLFFSRPAPPPA